MNYEDITNPEIKLIVYDLKYNSSSVESDALQALHEADNEEEFITNVKDALEGLCNEAKELTQALTKVDNEITIYVKGGAIQDITGIPEDIRITVIDWDVDGVKEDHLIKLKDGMARVSEWNGRCTCPRMVR